MTDPITRAVNVANRLAAAGLPATDANIDAAFRALEQEERTLTPYATGLKALAAQAAPLSTFESEYKATRLAALEATRAALDAANPLVPLRTAEELKTYAPPDAYAAGLTALRAKERR